MLVLPHERMPIARLLGFLEQGERVANQCAEAQARLAGEMGLPGTVARFLHAQARQEALHARLFQGAILWLAPRQLRPSPLLTPLREYERLLQAAIERRDLSETLMAEQIILEGLGEAILGRIEAGLVNRRAPLGRLRQTLLRQEEAHHAFGERMLARIVSQGQTSRDALRSRAPEYLGLSEAMVGTLADVFSDIDEDAAAWAADARSYCPQWLV